MERKVEYNPTFHVQASKQAVQDMAVVESLNKRAYKVTLGFLKIIPMLLAFYDLLNTVLDLCGIYIPIISYIGGVSLLTLAFLYLVSYVFRFCIYHRMFLHYILVNNILSIIEYTVGLPLSDKGLVALFISVAGIFLFLILYYYKKESCCKQ